MNLPQTLSSLEHLKAHYPEEAFEALMKNANLKLFFKLSEGTNLQKVDDPTHIVTVSSVTE